MAPLSVRAAAWCLKAHGDPGDSGNWVAVRLAPSRRTARQHAMLRESVHFHSEGERLAGILRIPDGAAAPRPAIVFCAGMSLTKEVWLPDYAERLVEQGYITLNFDYRGFGESTGEPRRRLLPSRQVEDARSALTYLETRPEVDASRLAVFGMSLGSTVATYTAGVDRRVRALVGVGGPGDLNRVWRGFDRFDSFFAKVKEARRRFVASGELSYIAVPKLLASDPATAALLEKEAERYPNWDLSVTFESLWDLFEMNAEAVVAQVEGGLWIYPEADALISRFEAQSLYAKARDPRRLLALPGAEHVEIYGKGPAFEAITAASLAWLEERLRR